jgi:hypothetical protein
MAFTLKVIKPKATVLNAREITAAVKRTMQQSADEAQRDFEATTAGWQHKVPFIQVPGPDYIVVGTEDEIWQYQDEGTRPHPIVPRNAKVLRFPAGGRVVYTKRVNHPGTKARGWSKMIATKWQRELPLRINEALAYVTGAWS